MSYTLSPMPTRGGHPQASGRVDQPPSPIQPEEKTRRARECSNNHSPYLPRTSKTAENVIVDPGGRHMRTLDAYSQRTREAAMLKPTALASSRASPTPPRRTGRRGNTKMTNEIQIRGNCEPRFDHVREVFREAFVQGDELGASVCVIVEGETLVDLFAGLGFQIPPAEEPLGPNFALFGHAGAGGSCGQADPENRMSFGYTMNLMHSGTWLVDPRTRALGRRGGRLRVGS